MAAQRKASCIQPGLPTFLRADHGRIVEETVFFFLLGQPHRLAWMIIGRQERLLTMEDRRVRVRGIVEAVDLACAERV